MASTYFRPFVGDEFDQPRNSIGDLRVTRPVLLIRHFPDSGLVGPRRKSNQRNARSTDLLRRVNGVHPGRAGLPLIRGDGTTAGIFRPKQMKLAAMPLPRHNGFE